MTISVPIIKSYNNKNGSSFQFIEVDEKEFDSFHFFKVVGLFETYFKSKSKEEKRNCLFQIVTIYKSILHNFYGDFIKQQPLLKEELIEVSENTGVFQKISGFDSSGLPIYQSYYFLLSEKATKEEKLNIVRKRYSFQTAVLKLNAVLKSNDDYENARDNFVNEYQDLIEEPGNDWLNTYFGLQSVFNRNLKKDIEN